MNSLLKYTKLAVPALLASTIAASAATLDFTSDSVDPFAGSIGTNGWTLTGVPGAAVKGDDLDSNPLNNGSAELAAVGLAGDFDGVGIDDPKNPDEVDSMEILTLTFDRKVRLTSTYFLDLFIDNQDPNNFEMAGVSNGSDEVMVAATNRYRTNGGFGEGFVNLVGTSFTFFEPANPLNDDVGLGDFALAGVTVEAVPLPAGFLLLGTALGGLGLARRRRKNA